MERTLPMSIIRSKYESSKIENLRKYHVQARGKQLLGQALLTWINA